MRCLNCGVCCTETEMLLAEKDIRRLLNKGFNKSFFVKFNEEGYAQLKNRKGYCVFYDTEKRRCSVYADRPSGCRVYPVIVDEEKGVVLDDICQARNTVKDTEKRLKGKRVIRLLRRIDCEAAKRRSWKTHGAVFPWVHWKQIILLAFWLWASFVDIRLVLTILPQMSQMNCTSATLSLLWMILSGNDQVPSFEALSFASKYSTYPLIVRLVSSALFLMSLCILSVTVMHLYPFLGKPPTPSILYRTIIYKGLQELAVKAEVYDYFYREWLKVKEEYAIKKGIRCFSAYVTYRLAQLMAEDMEQAGWTQTRLEALQV